MNIEAELAHEDTKKKIRIYAQMFAYEKLAVPKTTMQYDAHTGLSVPVTESYKEYEGKQLAVNYNDLYIPEPELDHLLKELCNAIKADMRSKGLVK
jgi:hypothetical protein